MQFGRYKIISQLGRGGMATVYLAEDPALNRKVAIKVLQSHLIQDTGLIERFSTEARTIASLRSMNIVEVFDFGIQDGRQFIVMEYMDGHTLQSLCMGLFGKPMNQDIAASLICQAAEGLVAAEKKGIIHRDIKPENLMFNSEGFLKIADFGIAHLANEQSRTATGAVLGSPNFMSPEQIDGLKPTVQTDMWALGGVMYYCLTGKLPFSGPTITATMRNVCEHPPTPPITEFKEIDPLFVKLTETLLNKEPENRGGGPLWLSTELRKFLNSKNIIDFPSTAKQFTDKIPLIQSNTMVEPEAHTPSTGMAMGIPLTPGTGYNMPGTPSPAGTGIAQPNISGITGITGGKKSGILVIGLLFLTVIILGGLLWKLMSGDSKPDNKISVQEVILSENNLVLQVEEKITLKPAIYPPGADKNVTWLSSAPEIAHVKDGVVTGIKIGRTYISVISRDNPAKSALARIIVVPKEKPVIEKPEQIEPPKPKPVVIEKPRFKPKPADTPKEDPATVEITSSPPFAKIKVNKKNWGETPMRTAREVPAGRCQIELIHKNFPPLDTVIKVMPGSQNKFMFRLK